jgi:hypothetical protein
MRKQLTFDQDDRVRGRQSPVRTALGGAEDYRVVMDLWWKITMKAMDIALVARYVAQPRLQIRSERRLCSKPPLLQAFELLHVFLALTRTSK